MTKFLLCNGANTTVHTTSGGQTPLEMAIFLGRGEIIKLIERASEGEEQAQRTDLPLRSYKRRASEDNNAEKYPRRDTDMTSDQRDA